VFCLIVLAHESNKAHPTMIVKGCIIARYFTGEEAGRLAAGR
jgi:hypothetical protein